MAQDPPQARGRLRGTIPTPLGCLVAAWLLAGCNGSSPPTTPPTACTAADTLCRCTAELPVGPGLPGALAPLGADSTFEMATWNLEFFPMDGLTTVNRMASVIRALQVDVWAIQEDSSVAYFDSLLVRLPGYAGVLSGDVYSDGTYQKTGIVHRKAAISLGNTRALFADQPSPFPRPPLEASLVFHSTAGDWNDVLGESPAMSSFPDFVGDSTDYRFLDESLAPRSDLYSHPATLRSLDHILVNRPACARIPRGSVITLRLDDIFADYAQEMSDHRPVLVVMGLPTPLASGGVAPGR